MGCGSAVVQVALGHAAVFGKPVQALQERRCPPGLGLGLGQAGLSHCQLRGSLAGLHIGQHGFGLGQRSLLRFQCPHLVFHLELKKPGARAHPLAPVHQQRIQSSSPGRCQIQVFALYISLKAAVCLLLAGGNRQEQGQDCHHEQQAAVRLVFAFAGHHGPPV